MKQDITRNPLGVLNISIEAIASISAIAASKVPGVIGMSGGVIDTIAQFLGKKGVDKGIRVTVDEKEVGLDLFIIVNFGSDISEIGAQVQEKVRDAVENMTGLSVREVNVTVQEVK
ncbi:MAG: Asp23/Gls24 family envelope stress response protein [Candidatus Firestonebacteria bacterium]